MAAAKAPMSMAEILEVLLSKARLEAEDAQRVLLGALNGLAALMLLEPGPNQTAMAVQTYRQVCGAAPAWLGCPSCCLFPAQTRLLWLFRPTER